MVMTSGMVVNGKIVFLGEPFAEGSKVTILAPESQKDAGFFLNPTEESALLEAMAQADRGEVISGEDLLRDIRPR